MLSVEHLDENGVLALVEGRLALDQRAVVERHIDACEVCFELVALVATPASAIGLRETERDLNRHLVAEALAPGDRVAERFRLDRIVGEGGMGVVWAARDEQRNEIVALKILKTVAPAEKKRFLREARLMQSFAHPAILDVREVVSVGDDGDVLLVMDLLDGESLGSQIVREERLSVDATLAIMRPLLGAVAAAHARGVVHRDLKPENVFLCRDGRVLLLDFGMAKLTQTLDLAMSGWMTESGLIVGTPHYMAPEQLYGERDIDARADVWAMGVVFHECLAGERPIAGRSYGQIVRAMSRREIIDIAECVPSLAREIVDVVRLMLSFDRELRPSLAEVLAALA